VVINSGNANACTGERGDQDARWMTEEVGRRLGCQSEDVLVCSTGVIGRFLPCEKIGGGIAAVVDRLAPSPDGFRNAATAMMTTDTYPKMASRTLRLSSGEFTVSGAAKGAAMIGPNMATMLGVLVTDVPLSSQQADTMLRHAVDRSFHCVSVDGHTSTSDSVILLSSSARSAASIGTKDLSEIGNAIDEVAAELARGMIRDAEGASHFITIDVRGTRTREEALRIAKTIADSPLVKTAIAGGDPNWGRIVSAAGYSGVALREKDLTLTLNGILLYRSGAPAEFDAAAVSSSLKSNRDVRIELDLPLGDGTARFWTSDLTAEYVRLNADYTT
jgi:glutamate N-acetyltransferase/amino-acid N-acetyltransferase